MRIAIFDRDPNQLVQFAQLLETQIVSDTPVVCETFREEAALQRNLSRESFDLLIFEWQFIDGSGPRVLQWLRNWRRDCVPIVAVGSRASELDLAQALDLGADDYIAKPVHLHELRARVQRLVNRQGQSGTGGLVRVGPWEFDRISHSAVLRRETGATHLLERYELTPREFDIALKLFQNIGRTLSRSHLLESAGSDEENASRTLDSHIYRLRHKLHLKATNGFRLQAVYGRGYRLEASLGGESDVTHPPRCDEASSMNAWMFEPFVQSFDNSGAFAPAHDGAAFARGISSGHERTQQC